MSLRVECLPEGDEPAVIWFGRRRVHVRAVIDRWWGSHQRWWKVSTDEGDYVLRRDDATHEWELAAVVGREGRNTGAGR